MKRAALFTLGFALLAGCTYDFQQYIADGDNGGESSAAGGHAGNGGSKASAGGNAQGGDANAGAANAGATSGGATGMGGKASAGMPGMGGKASAGMPGMGGKGSGGATGAGGKASGGTTSTGGSKASGGATQSACAGVSLGGVCWYLSALNQSCSQACAAHGGVDVAAESFVGVAAQGGSLADCAAVLDALGAREAPVEGSRSDGIGVGCHVFPLETRLNSSYWLTSPRFSVTARMLNVSVACGCLQ